MASKLANLIDDPLYYMSSFKVFSAESAKYGSEYAEWRETIFSDSVLPKVLANLEGVPELRYLGVGSGSGRF